MGSFSDDIDRFAAKSKMNLQKTVQYAIILAAQGVIQRSPVGNPDLWKEPVKGYVGGRFRANWRFGIGSIDPSTSPAIDKNGQATLGAIIGQVKANVVGDRIANVFWITNSLPYGHRLEYEGWSRQAPSGMVRLTLLELPAAVEAYAKGLL